MKTKRKRSTNVLLTERDFNFFRFLFNHKVVSVTQAKNYCYPTADLSNMRKRLRKFMKLKLINEDAIVYLGKVQRVFSLSPKGLAKLKAIEPLCLKRTQLRSNSKVHDHVLVDIAYHLKNLTETQLYYSENELQCIHTETDDELDEFIENHSDGYLSLTRAGVNFKFAVEYEHSEKSKIKYIDLAFRYYLSCSVDYVLYFYKDEWVKNTIVNYMNENYSKSQPKFYFSKIENYFDASKNLTYVNRKGQNLDFDLREIGTPVGQARGA